MQTACLSMEGAEVTENTINGVERPVKSAELCAFTLRVRAGNTDVLTDAGENVRQQRRDGGVRYCLSGAHVLTDDLVVRGGGGIVEVGVFLRRFGVEVEKKVGCGGVAGRR